MTTLVYCPTSGKRSYETYADAHKALHAIQSKPHRRRLHAGVYSCELGCGSFHITENMGQRKRKKRNAERAKQERG